MARKRRLRGTGTLKEIRPGAWRGRTNIISSLGEKREVSKIFYSQDKPESEFEEWKVKVRREPPAREKATIADLVDFWDHRYRQRMIDEKEMKEKTAEFYYYMMQRIKNHMGDRIAQKITLMEVQDFISALKKEKLDWGYIKRHAYLLRRIFKFANKHKKANLSEQIGFFEDDELMPREKSIELENEEEERKIQPDELEKLEKAAQKNILLYRIIQTMKYSGMRRSEALGMRWPNVLNDRVIVSHQLKKKKGGGFKLEATKSKKGRRAFPIIKQLRDVFMQQKSDQEIQIADIGKEAWKDPIGELIFTLEDGRPIDPHLFNKWFRKARQEAELREQITPHHIRHFFVSTLNRIGVNKTVRKVFAGHADEDFNEEVYTHAFPEDIEKAAQALENHYENNEPST